MELATLPRRWMTQDISSLADITLQQWFLTFFDVLNPTSFMHAVIEPFLGGKIKSASSLKFKTYVYTIYCIVAQTGQAESYVTNHKSGLKKTAEPLKLTLRTQVTNHYPTYKSMRYLTFSNCLLKCKYCIG